MKRLLVATLLLFVVNFYVSSQEVPFPETPDDPASISPWGHTSKGTNWDTSPYLPFIYNGIAFRLMPPNGITYDSSMDTWDFGAGEKYPVILFFHGVGERGTDNNNTLKHGGRIHRDAVLSDEFPGFLVYPQNAYIDDMKELLDQLIAEGYPIDLTRVYVHGLSRGAVWSWEFALEYPGTVAAIAPQSGMVDGDFSDLIYTPIRLGQGGRDRNPAPGWTFERIDYMHSIGGDIELFYYPNSGHGIWNNMYNLPDFFTWFLEQRVNKIYAKFDYFEVCPEDPIDVTLGVNPGLAGYEWRKDGVLLAGETNHEIQVSEFGDYQVRVDINGEWSEWSEAKTVGERQPTDTPPINLASLQTTVLPDPNGESEVDLILPDGYETYEWFRDGISISTESSISVGAGTYTALVQEEFGCSSNLSDPFVIIDNTFTDVPNIPQNLNIVDPTKTSLRLTWTDNSSNETGFEIYRRLSTDDPYVMIALLPANSVQFLDEPLLSGVEYYYSVRAVNGNGASEVSAEVEGLTDSDTNKPTAPQELSQVESTTSSITVQWLESTDDIGVKGYYVYVDGAKTYFTEETEFVINELTEGQVYRINVSAVDLSGNESPLSNRIVAVAVFNGLSYEYFEGTWSNLPDFDALTPVKTGISSNVDISVRDQDNNFGFRWTGYIKIPVAGDYTFETLSDDGSKLYIGAYDENDLVVNNDGLHGNRYREGTINFANAGVYPIVMTFFERGGGQNMQVFWKNTAHGVGSRQLIPDAAFTDDFTIPEETIFIPTNFVATGVNHNAIKLDWDDTNVDEIGYQVFRAPHNSTSFESIAIVSQDVETYTDSTAVAETTYDYKLIALGNYVESGEVNASGTSLPLVPPAAPEDFVADSLSVESIQLSWTIGVDIDGYELSRSSDNINFNVIATLSNTVDSFIDIELNAQTTYYYTLRAYNYHGYSDPSSEESTTFSNRPVINSQIAYQRVDTEEVRILGLNAYDADGGDIDFEGISLPGFVSVSDIDATNGEVTITPDITDLGVHQVQVHAVDGFGGVSDTISFEVEVYQNSSPTIEVLNTTLYDTISSEYQVTLVVDEMSVLSFLFSDVDGDPIDDVSVTNLPSFGNLQQVNDNDASVIFDPSAGDIGLYVLELVVVDGLGKIGTFEFNIDVVATDPNTNPVTDFESILVNFTSSSQQIGSLPWNNMIGDPIQGMTISDMINSDEAPTTIDLMLNDEWYQATNKGAVTGDDSGVFPDMVMNTHFEDNSSEGRSITLSGLDQLKIYDLYFFASYSSKKKVSTRITNFQHDGVEAGLITNDNTSEVVSLRALSPDINGEIEIQITGKNDAWFYLNALEIRYYDEPVAPFSPTNLSAQASSSQVISLQWDDNSSNEDNFEVYRTTDPSGTWDQIATLGPDVTTYQDIGLQENTLYYYQVLARNTNGASDYSNVVQESTLLDLPYQAVQINFTTKSDHLGGGTWNDLLGSPNTGLALDNLTTTLGTNSNLRIELLNSWKGGNAGGTSTGDNSGIYPDNVMLTNFYDDANSPRELLLSGCDPNKVYEIILFSSRLDSYNSTSTITINGTTEGVAVGSNTENTASISGIKADGDGNIEIDLWKDEFTYWTYVNAIEIRYFDEPEIPFSPVGLSARTLSHSEIELMWSDVSTNEDGFEIFRSTSSSGPFNSLTTTGANVTSFIDSDLQQSTEYFYYVQSNNANGSSVPTDIASSVTFEYSPYTTMYVNFSNWYEEPSPWNNMVGLPPSAGLRIEDLTDSRGFSSTVAIELLTPWSGSDHNGTSTGNESGVYPDEVMKTFFEDNSNNTNQILITGLETNKLYDLVFFSSRAWVTDQRTTRFTVNGKSAETIADDNTSVSASIEVLQANASGELLIEVDKVGSNPVKYLNAMEIKSYDPSPIPFDPELFAARAISSDAIRLSWKDKSLNEDNFEIYRGSSSSGPWNLIQSVPADTEEYTDSGLTSDTRYYYRLRAVNTEGESNFIFADEKTRIYYPIEYVNVNFTNWEQVPSPWNNLVGTSPDAGLGITDMVNTNGFNSGMNIELLTSWSFSDHNGTVTGDDSGVYPDDVMRTFFEDNTATPMQILLSGLDVNKLYNLVFFGSRAWVTDSRESIYSAGGSSATLIVDGNTTHTALIDAVSPDTNGEILIEVAAGVGTTKKYINALEIQFYNEPLIPFDPEDFVASALSSESIELTWRDRSTNEDGFEIFRSTNGIDNWNSIAVLAPNSGEYIDAGLTDSTRYYYRIQSYNANGSSDGVFADELTRVYYPVENVKINFSYYLTEGAPWNDLVAQPSASAGMRIDDLDNAQGFRSGISVELLDTWGAADHNGTVTGDDSGIYPDDVMRTFFSDQSEDDMRILFSGLDVNKRYDFTFFSSRAWVTDNRETTFEIDGISASLIVDDNTSNVALLDGFKPNPQGEITVNVNKAAGTPTKYLNAMELHYYDEPDFTAAPGNLFANAISRTQIDLTWTDESVNEDEFELYKSSDGTNWTLLGLLPKNSTSYSDAGLLEGENYYYRIRANGAQGYSEYSNVANESTYDYFVYLNIGGSDFIAPSPWNNTSMEPFIGNTLEDLSNENGDNTGIVFELVDNVYGHAFDANGSKGSVTGDDSGVYPDVVMQSYFWIEQFNTATIKFSGLNLNKEYDFEFFASRAGDNRATKFIIGEKEATLDADYNTTETVIIYDIHPNEFGEIYVDVTSKEGALLGYINAIVIKTSDRSIEDETYMEASSARTEEVVEEVTELPEVVEEEVSSIETVVYPIPFTESFNVGIFTESSQVLRLVIFDLNGRTMKSITRDVNPGTGKITIDSSEFDSGIYLLSLAFANGHVQTYRIIKR